MGIGKDYKYEWCMDCKKDHSDKQEEPICECGGRNFLFGDTIINKDGEFQCECGSKEFKMMSHFNMNPIYNTTLKCVSCGAIVGKQTYYESPYMD